MTVALKDGKTLVNIKMVEVITEEASPKTTQFDTSTEAGYSPDISEGQETILRVKDKIIGVNKTEDLQYGSTLTFKDTTFLAEVFALVDGGLLAGTSGAYTGYTPPVVGSAVSRTLFTLNVYTEEKDISGEVTNYYKFSFPHCKGTPAKFTFQDGQFFAPEYTIVSRPAKGEAPYSLSILSDLV